MNTTWSTLVQAEALAGEAGCDVGSDPRGESAVQDRDALVAERTQDVPRPVRRLGVRCREHPFDRGAVLGIDLHVAAAVQLHPQHADILQRFGHIQGHAASTLLHAGVD